MFLCIRRTAAVFTLAIGYLSYGKTTSVPAVFCVSLIALGALVAGYTELSANIIGYLAVVANNLLTAVYLNATNKFSAESGMNSFGLLYYNSILAFPLCLILALCTGEVRLSSAIDTFLFLTPLCLFKRAPK